jgi:hypothetical protein
MAPREATGPRAPGSASTPCANSSTAVHSDKSLGRRRLPLAKVRQQVLVRVESRRHVDLRRVRHGSRILRAEDSRRSSGLSMTRFESL